MAGALVALLLAAAAALPGQAASATSPGENGKIVFFSERDGNAEIYIMNSDGSEQTRLTEDSAPDLEPAWSPDGSKVAFVSGRDNSRGEIYVMNADGTGQTRLTVSPGASSFSVSPSWTPDGRIAFVSNVDGRIDAYIMNADGSQQSKLAQGAPAIGEMSWSFDGGSGRIAFVGPGTDEIFVADADGANRSQLTNNTELDHYPDWSPDGGKILFSSSRDGQYEVYVMNSDGSNQTRLTDNPIKFNTAPSWSPDGTAIAFSSDREGEYDIYLMNADGSEERNISNSPGIDYDSDWQPVSPDHPPGSPPAVNGENGKIAFTTARDENFEIYAANEDGTELARLTSNNASDTFPRWSPDGTKIAFQLKRRQ